MAEAITVAARSTASAGMSSSTVVAPSDFAQTAKTVRERGLYGRNGL